jgi:hypothetical protein
LLSVYSWLKENKDVIGWEQGRPSAWHTLYVVGFIMNRSIGHWRSLVLACVLSSIERAEFLPDHGEHPISHFNLQYPAAVEVDIRWSATSNS